MTLSTVALAVVAVTALSGHVAPSVDDNNRYLKVTPLADGLRLSYTVFFGEIPGASERRAMDADRDGRIQEDEARRFAERIGGEVRDSLELDADGARRRLAWAVVSPGLGTDAVAAGAFSVDLVAYVCVAARARHRLTLRDAFRIPRPGETEVKVEDGPGITIRRARVGAADDPSHDLRFVGPGGPLTDSGLELEWTAGGPAATVPDGRCAAPARPGRSSPLVAFVLAGALGATTLAVAALRARRRARARAERAAR